MQQRTKKNIPDMTYLFQMFKSVNILINKVIFYSFQKYISRITTKEYFPSKKHITYTTNPNLAMLISFSLYLDISQDREREKERKMKKRNVG